MTPEEAASQLTSDQMQKLAERVFSETGESFEVMSITKVGESPQVTVKLKSGLTKTVVL